MKFDKSMLHLYAVTDRMWTQTQTLSDQISKAIDGKITCLQLREKELSYEEFLKEAIEIKSLCKSANIPFIINDDVDVAIACKADGIHVGQSDMSALNVREKIGKHMILGVSVANVEQAIEAEKAGADYIGVGAVFKTSTKDDADFVPHNVLKDICDSISIPVVAIGGIYKHNIKELKGTGIDGVALVSAIFSAKDIRKECLELFSLIEGIK